MTVDLRGMDIIVLGKAGDLLPQFNDICRSCHFNAECRMNEDTNFADDQLFVCIGKIHCWEIHRGIADSLVEMSTVQKITYIGSTLLSGIYMEIYFPSFSYLRCVCIIMHYVSIVCGSKNNGQTGIKKQNVSFPHMKGHKKEITCFQAFIIFFKNV